jgi:Mn2+/Fe2+ NRAMP family transporter
MRQRNHRLPLTKIIGPGVVAGASDNDPTTVGAVTVVGAQTGYRLSWLALLIFPMLSVVQEVAAHVGVVTHTDLQRLTTERYGRRIALLLLATVVSVSVFTIAADLEAGAASLGVLAGIDGRWFVFPLGLFLVALVALGTYRQILTVLRYLLVGFFAYAAAAFLAHPAWSQVLRDSFVPKLAFNRAEVAGALSLVGTTLTSYVYIWEGIEQSEARLSLTALRAARIDARTGAAFTVISFWFILVASGATLGAHHLKAATAQDAARGLEPLAGHWAADLFAVGLLASAAVALPVLMATTAYVVGAEFDWRRGLSEGITQAKKFYAVLLVAIALGSAFAAAGISPLGILVAASIAGGFGTPLGLAILLLIARDATVMNGNPITWRLALAGWSVTIVVGGLGLLYLMAGLLGRL